MELNHINIKAPMPLLLKEKEFFCTILNLKEGIRPAFSKKGFWLYSNNRHLVHLTESDMIRDRDSKGYFDHFAFCSTGLKLFISVLEKHKQGYEIKRIEEIGATQVFIRSPLNIRIEVMFIDEDE